VIVAQENPVHIQILDLLLGSVQLPFPNFAQYLLGFDLQNLKGTVLKGFISFLSFFSPYIRMKISNK